jgi:hypothetical protein
MAKNFCLLKVCSPKYIPFSSPQFVSQLCRKNGLILIVTGTRKNCKFKGFDAFEICRLDKYLSLVRKTLREIFSFLKNKNWDQQLLQELNTYLLDNPLDCINPQASLVGAHVGLKYFVIENLIEEAEKFEVLERRNYVPFF